MLACFSKFKKKNIYIYIYIYKTNKHIYGKLSPIFNEAIIVFYILFTMDLAFWTRIAYLMRTVTTSLTIGQKPHSLTIVSTSTFYLLLFFYVFQTAGTIIVFYFHIRRQATKICVSVALLKHIHSTTTTTTSIRRLHWAYHGSCC